MPTLLRIRGNIFKTALDGTPVRDRSNPIFKLRKLLFTFRLPRCQNSVVSNMCYQSDKALTLYVLTIMIDTTSVCFVSSIFFCSRVIATELSTKIENRIIEH